MVSENSDEIDQRGIPTHKCFNCGSEWFRVLCRFEDYEIAQYMVEALCAGCNAAICAPTLVDHPYWDPDKKEITDKLPPLDD